MAQGTAEARTDHSDHSAAHSVVMAALGQPDEPEVDDDATGDTDATETAADDVEDSDESAETPEESTEEGTESDDAEPEESVEAKGEDDDSPFTAADKAALAKAPPEVQRLAKSLRRSYAEKTTEIAKFQKMIQGNPQEVLQRIAEANGLKVNFGDAKVVPATPAAESTTDAVAAVIEAQRAEWLPILGEGATNAMLAGMQRIADTIAGSKVAPIIAGNATREQAAMQAQVNSDFERFSKEYPDWKTHEAAMMALMPQVNPNLGTYEKTSLLYRLATHDKQVSKAKTEGATKLAAKVAKSAAVAEPPPRTRVPGMKVKAAMPTFKSTRDAVVAAMAEQGIEA